MAATVDIRATRYYRKWGARGWVVHPGSIKKSGIGFMRSGKASYNDWLLPKQTMTPNTSQAATFADPA
jgi:hypothetical protein